VGCRSEEKEDGGLLYKGKIKKGRNSK